MTVSAYARRYLVRAPSLPVLPFRVEPFTGSQIRPGQRGYFVTDWHIVDARGRTFAVVPWRPGVRYSDRRRMADRIVAELTRDAA